MDIQALNQSKTFYVWLDLEGRLVDANPAFVAYVNAPLDGLRGLRFVELIAPEDRPRFEQAWGRILESRDASVCIPLKSFQSKQYEINLHPIAGSEPLKLLAEIHVVGEASHGSAAIIDQQHIFQRLLEEGDETIYWMDPQGVILYINPAVKQYGLDAAELTGKHWSTYVTPEDHFIVQSASEHIGHGRSEILSLRLVAKDGKLKPVRITSHPIMENGKLIGTRGLFLPPLDQERIGLTFERRAAQLALLNRIGEVIASGLDLDQMLNNTIQLLHKGFGYFHVALFLPQPNGTLKMSVRAGALAHRFPVEHSIKPGQGIVGWVAEAKKTALVNEVSADLRYVNLFPDRITTQAELAVPIVAEGRLHGVIDLQSPEAKAFEENDVRVIETVARQLALAMVNARLYAELQHRLREQEYAETLMRLQRDVLVDLTSIHDFDLMLQVVLGKLTHIDGIDCGSIYLVDEDGALDMVASSGLTPAFAAIVSYLPPQSNKARMVREGKPLYSRYKDLPLDPRISAEVRDQENIRSLVAFPIQFNQKIIADLTLASHTLDEIPMQARNLVEAVASHLGSTIARIKIEKELAASEAQSRALLEALPDLFFVCDSHGRFLDYRSAAGYHLYAQPEEFIGRTLHDVLPDEVATPALEAIRNAIFTRRTEEFHYKLYSEQKKLLEYYEARISASSEDLVIIIIRNITERVNYQAKIEKLERKYRTR